MRIQFIIPRMGGGGSERVVSVLSDSFCKNGHLVHIAQLINSDSFYELNSNVTISGMDIRIRRNNTVVAKADQARFVLKSLLYLRNTINDFKPDVVITFMRQSCILMWLLRKAGVRAKWIASERNDPTVPGRVTRAIMRNAYGQCDLFVAQSENVLRYYSGIIGKGIVISNPVVNHPELFIEPGARRNTVVAVGRLVKQKNFFMLIKSFTVVHKTFPEYNLEIYGEGPLRKELEDYVKSLDANEYITLMGTCTDLLKNINSAKLFVMSSNYEGFPNALTEAMSVGLPVISTDFFTGVAHELIGKANGMVVPVGNASALADAMITMLLSKERLLKCSINNIREITRYSTNVIVKEWEGAIVSIFRT